MHRFCDFFKVRNRWLCTVKVPERIRFWHKKVHLSANQSCSCKKSWVVIGWEVYFFMPKLYQNFDGSQFKRFFIFLQSLPCILGGISKSCSDPRIVVSNDFLLLVHLWVAATTKAAAPAVAAAATPSATEPEPEWNLKFYSCRERVLYVLYFIGSQVRKHEFIAHCSTCSSVLKGGFYLVSVIG